MGFKNYYNSHKEEIHKEIEQIQKLDLKQSLIDHFSLDSENYLSELKNAPSKFNVFIDLEKFIEIKLRV